MKIYIVTMQDDKNEIYQVFDSKKEAKAFFEKVAEMGFKKVTIEEGEE